jgi:hypothetical protein
LGQGDDASSPDALDDPAGQQLCEIVRHTAEDGADGEEERAVRTKIWRPKISERAAMNG